MGQNVICILIKIWENVAEQHLIFSIPKSLDRVIFCTLGRSGQSTEILPETGFHS